MEQRLTVLQVVHDAKETMKPGETKQYSWTGDIDLSLDQAEADLQKHFGKKARVRVCRPFMLEVRVQVDPAA